MERIQVEEWFEELFRCEGRGVRSTVREEQRKKRLRMRRKKRLRRTRIRRKR